MTQSDQKIERVKDPERARERGEEEEKKKK
jgi:hypothetical protein